MSDDPDGEFWIIACLERAPSVPEKPAPQPLTELHSLPVRYINRADLLSWAIPISNWARIMPFLVSHRRYRDKLLEQHIMSHLNRDETLDAVVGCFPQRDEITVQAALFQLLAEGRVISPDLAYTPLDGSTRFHRLPVVLTPS